MRRATLKPTALVAGLLAILPAAAAAAAGSAPRGREGAGTDPHPRLFFDSGDLPRLRARLRKGTVGGFCGEALSALLHGRRDDKSISQLMSKRDPRAGCLIYDFQYPFMTDEERKQAREWLLGDAEKISRKAATGRPWYFGPNTNNWIICGLTKYSLQRLVFTGLLFPGDPRSAAMREQAKKLIDYFFRGPGDMMEESLTAVNGYGTYNLYNIAYLLMAIKQNAKLMGMDPYEYQDRVMYSDGRYRTYLYQSSSSSRSKVYGLGARGGSTGVYCVPLGGHGGYHAHPFVPSGLLFLAGAYREPVFVWLYLKSARGTSWRPGGSCTDLRDLLFRGAAPPASPAELGWPLEAHFPKSGVAIMRRSWADDASVVVLHSGWAGSHPQPCQGQVVFTGGGWTVLGKMSRHPRSGGYNDTLGIFYSRNPHTNNILFIDGESQPDLYQKACRQSFGRTVRLGPDVYAMDSSEAYRSVAPKLSWVRIVRYDRARDLLIIVDRVDTGDGKSHEFMFNWVTEAEVLDETTYDMPGPYFMAARVVGPKAPLSAKTVLHHDYWAALNVSVVAPTGRLSVIWAVGPAMAVVKDAVRKDVAELVLKTGARRKVAREAPREAPPRPVAKVEKTRKAGDEAVAAWDAKLRARVKKEVADGRRVQLSVAAFQQRFEVVSVDEAGTLELKSALTEMSMEWPRLALADRKSLALAVLRDGSPPDHCLAAFYLIASGDEKGAEEHLARGGDGAAEVEASFAIAGAETVAGEAPAAEGAEPVEQREPRARLVPKPTPAEEKPVRREADAALAKLYREAETAFIDGDVEGARALFERVVRDHPDSEYAVKAGEYLGIIE